MRIIGLAIVVLTVVLKPLAAQAAPGPSISKPKSTSSANRAIDRRAAQLKERGMLGRLRLAEQAKVISQSQHRVAREMVDKADQAHEAAQGANIAASARLLRVRADANASRRDIEAAEADVERTRAARTAARDRFRRAQAIETEIGGQMQQNTAVSNALRRGQWDRVDANQATLTPMPAPPLPGAGN